MFFTRWYFLSSKSSKSSEQCCLALLVPWKSLRIIISVTILMRSLSFRSHEITIFTSYSWGYVRSEPSLMRWLWLLLSRFWLILMEVLAGKIIELNVGFSSKPCLMTPVPRIKKLREFSLTNFSHHEVTIHRCYSDTHI